jgi:predicted glycoside hydrolase/deacetylase ChbG (UPF0249 family)
MRRLCNCLVVFGFVVATAGLLAAQEQQEQEDKGNATDGKRYVIIHADDCGMSHSVNEGTIQAMEEGIVSSCSIMVPCPWFPEFARYAKEHPEKDFGIHLTLTCEWENYEWGPVAGRENVPSLCDENGYLWDNVNDLRAAAVAKEAEIELRAQIERAKAFGVRISHLDPHMGAAISRPDLLEIYVNLGVEYDVPVLFVQRRPDRETRREYPAMAGSFEKMRSFLEEKNLPLLDSLFQYYTQGPYEERKAKYLDVLKNMKPGVHEIIIHCGIENAELRAITNSAPLRDSDRRVFTDPEVIQAVKDMGIEPIGWKKFREIAAAKAGQAPGTTASP